MRYRKGHKDQTRRRVLTAAAERMRRDGIAATGVAGLMADAGLTHGGFYAHFPSKEALVREALGTALEGSRRYLRERAAKAGRAGGSGLAAIVEGYLTAAHRDQPGRGCAIAALAAELARHPQETRVAFTENVTGLLAIVEAELPAALDPAERRQRALAIVATLVGALQMARVVGDPALSDDFLAAGKRAALGA